MRYLGPLMLWSGVFVAAGCGDQTVTSPRDLLTGTVTCAGATVDVPMVIAVDADGTEARGAIVNGQYTIESPPRGKLRLVVFDAPESQGKVPEKYRSLNPKNDLSVDFQGGQQTFDIVLQQ